MRRIVLVGAGHAHMMLLAQAHVFSSAGIELHLVAPGRFWYGAHIAAMLAGQVDATTLCMPLRAFCRSRDVVLHSDRGIGLDTRHRRIWLAGGDVLEYDAVSLDVGRRAVLERYDARAHGVRVWDGGSVSAMVQLRAVLAADVRVGRPHVAIIGDDAGAAAIAAGLSGGDLGSCLDLGVYAPGSSLLPGAPSGAGRRLAWELARRGVDVVFDAAIEGVAARSICSPDGRRFAADHVVVADRYRAGRLVHAGGLASETDGLYVTPRLHAPADERVFAAGGCARLTERALPLQDVQRQAAVLAHNLRACLARRPYRTYRPWPGVAAVDLADGRAIGWTRRLWWHGRTVAWLKARRDRNPALAWRSEARRYPDGDERA